MDTTLNRLIDIDKQARATVAGAEQYNSDVMNRLGTDIEALKQKYTSEAERRLGAIRSSEETAAQDADGAAERRYAELTRQLEEGFASRHDELCDQLFDRCIGR